MFLSCTVELVAIKTILRPKLNVCGSAPMLVTKTFYDINLSIVSIMGTNSHKLTLKTQLFFQLGMSVLFLSCLVFVWPIFPDGFITAKLKNVNLSFMVDVMVMPTTLTPRRIVRSLV